MFAYLATFSTFAALVLEVFTLLACTFNQPFLRDIYFVRYYNSDSFIVFGLWGYCTSTNGHYVTSCSANVAAFDWTTARNLSDYGVSFPSMGTVFLAQFILYWIVFAITLGSLLVTMLGHFGRQVDLLASFATFLGFILMLVVFIMLLVISLRGVNQAYSSHHDSNGFLGPCIWMNLGAMIALFCSSFWYCFSCIFARRN
ncbi:hypothetical protein BC940DRAFT_314345 [Gongronella butleri]|nr:hypothetical protein BC940DRAFT_314345 [Gongronella butleri]